MCVFSLLARDNLCSCFDRVYAAEEQCILNYQLDDVCTTKRLQQVRQFFSRIESSVFLFTSNRATRPA